MRINRYKREYSPQIIAVSIVIIGLLVGTVVFLLRFLLRTSSGRSIMVMDWLRNPGSHNELAIKAGDRCGNSPFIFPTDGLIGYLWDDSFQLRHRHQGLDIFGGGDVNLTPVIAAYDGYLSRLPDWKSSVIMRVPDDPLQPGRQIWLYYTHMADRSGNSFIDAAFPPGTNEVFVPAGTLLGHQGNYSGDPNNPVGVHLHFSIVRDDGNGKFRNELEITNTLDPSPYFNLMLNANENRDKIPVCEK